jgi:photosystem II stability/assembly factor-like uncharacterized protein
MIIMKKIIYSILIGSILVYFSIEYKNYKIEQKISKGLLVKKPFGLPIQKEPSAIPNEWFGQQRTWPHGKFDESFYLESLNLVSNFRQERNQHPTRENWISIGPTNIGGRITDIEIHEENPNTIYIGSASGGIYKSIDNAQSWIHVFKNAPVISIGDIAIDNNNPNIIYAGTGEANSSSFSFPGNGIYKSIDGGESWHQSGLIESAYFGRILVDHSNSNIIFSAVCGSLFSPGPNRGIYRSQDGGESWENVLFVTDSTSAIDLVQHPTNPNILYASMWERIRGLNYRRSGGPSSGIYKTIDGGNTWVELTNGLPQTEFVGRIGIDISQSNPEILYAFYDKQMSGDDENSFLGIFKTINGGDSWQQTNGQNLEAMNRSFGWYFGQIRIDPINPNTAYALGVELAKTVNGGNSWEIIAGYFNSDVIHVDNHALEFSTQQNKIWIGNDGGLYNTLDEGSTWNHFNNIPLTQFYKMEIDPSNPEIILGGTQDNGTNRADGNPDHWENILGGDGFYSEIHPDNSNIIYSEYQWGQIRKSVNAGASWSSIGFEFRDDRKNWSTPFLLDMNSPDQLIVGTYRIWKTVDGGNSFYSISDDLTQGDDGTSYHTITCLAQSQLHSNLLLAGTDDGRVHLSTEDGSWNDISNDLPQRWITSVEFDPINENLIYSTLSGFRWDEEEAHIFKSFDLGETWVSIQGDLPEFPVNCIVINPDINSHILVGTDAGIFGTIDGGLHWNVFGNNLPAVPITDLKFHESTHTLVVGTYGCSSYKLNWNPFLLGDPTMDGVINVTDVIFIINIILEQITPSENEFIYSDLNEDNIINVLDIIAVVNLILS